MKYKLFPEHILSRLGTVEYWKSLNPELSITNQPFLKPAAQLGTDATDTGHYVSQMQQEGYFKLDSVLPESDVTVMAHAIARLVEEGFPPSFAYVYDEFWRVYRNVSPLMEPILGKKCRLSTNLWAWYIPSTGKDAGFAPHRDIINAPAMRSDGTPMMATIWIPLRDVTTSHACMHVLPLNMDPNAPDNMESVNIPDECIQSIRALPAKAGSILSWNMDTIHWSSCSSKWADGPRISIAAYLGSADGPNITSISMEPMQPLTLDFRLGVIGIMMNWFNEADLDKDHYPEQLLDFCGKYYHCEPSETRFTQPGEKESRLNRQSIPVTTYKTGRNEPCPCGSGKKYKHCHGK